ncbi:MAG: hypothetical protein AAF637_27995, partial [Pseudomonadota bacterium]
MKPAIVMALLDLVCLPAAAPHISGRAEPLYALSKEVAWNNILAFLRANDLTVVRSDPAAGTIEAR